MEISTPDVAADFAGIFDSISIKFGGIGVTSASQSELDDLIRDPETVTFLKFRELFEIHPSVSDVVASLTLSTVIDCVVLGSSRTVYIEDLRQFHKDMHLLKDMHFYVTHLPTVAKKKSLPMWLSPKVKELLTQMEIGADGMPDSITIIENLGLYGVLREAVRAKQEIDLLGVEKYVNRYEEDGEDDDCDLNGKGTNDEDDDELHHLEHLTEEEILDRELERTTQEYWNKKAEAIFLRADQAQQDKCLSKLEIRNYLLTNPPPEETWILKWLMEADGGGNFHKYDKTKDGEISLRELKEVCRDWALVELGASFSNHNDHSALVLKRELNERAEKIMKKADQSKRNYKLNRDEITAFGHLLADAEERLFVTWILNHFNEYDSDMNGEMDLQEFRVAIRAWAEESRQTRNKYVEKNRAMMERKKELSDQRKDMLKNADSRASEIMELCNFGSNSGHTITVLHMRTKILPVEKLRPFAEWMLKDRMKVWRRHDKDKSGTIDLGELENALEEYFDEVASEFDEFRGDGGYYMNYRTSRRNKRIIAELDKRPSPPMFKGCDGDKVTFEWRKEWQGLRLVLQSLLVNATTLEDAKLMERDKKVTWVTIYRGRAPRADVALSQPTALYMFRTVALDEQGVELQMELSASSPVFWMSRPLAPVVCGLGRNVLVSWVAPVLPPSLARTLRPSRPFWKLHVSKSFNFPNTTTTTSPSVVRSSVSSSQNMMTKPRRRSSDDNDEEIIVNVGQGHTWCLVPNLTSDSVYDFSLSIEFPMGTSNKSAPTRFSTQIPAPLIQNPFSKSNDDVSKVGEEEDADEKEGRGRNALSFKSGNETLSVRMPSLIDPNDELTKAGIQPVYRAEGANIKGFWDAFHKGNEQEVNIHGLVPNMVSKIRVRTSVDLRRCCRYGNGPILVHDTHFTLQHNPLVEKHLAPPSAFGSYLYNDDFKGGGGLSGHREIIDDDDEVGSGVLFNNDSATRLFNFSNDSVGSKASKGSSMSTSVVEGAWACPLNMIPFPGTSKARSEKFAELVGNHTVEFDLNLEKQLLLGKNGERYFWDISASTLACIAPSLPLFRGNEVCFNTSHSINGDAVESLAITCTEPRMIQETSSNPGLNSLFAIEVFDKSSNGWFRAYQGSSPRCDLAAITRAELTELQNSSGGNAGRFLPSNCWTLPGVFLLIRSAIQIKEPVLSTTLRRTSNKVSSYGSNRSSSKRSMQMKSSIPRRSGGRSLSPSSSDRCLSQKEEELMSSSLTSFSSPSKNVNNNNGGLEVLNNNICSRWLYSEEMVVMLSPQPPWCEWCDENKRAVNVKWSDSFDTSKLPMGVKVPPLLFSLEVATGPLLQDDGNNVEESKEPLLSFEEVAVAPGSHSVNSGPLMPGSRYAFRLRCDTPNGSSVSAPYYVQTEPTVPSTPDLPRARTALFKSATGKETSFVQISWKCPEHNGLKVDRYLLQCRKTRPTKEDALKEPDPKTFGGVDRGEYESSLNEYEMNDKGKEKGELVKPENAKLPANPTKKNIKNSVDDGWVSVYIGPHLSASDETTLHLLQVNKQYRVRAGSQLGWSAWSPVLTVQGSLNNGDGGGGQNTWGTSALQTLAQPAQIRKQNSNTNEEKIKELVLPDIVPSSQNDDPTNTEMAERVTAFDKQNIDHKVAEEKEKNNDEGGVKEEEVIDEVKQGEKFESQMIVPCQGAGKRMLLTLYVGSAMVRRIQLKKENSGEVNEPSGDLDVSVSSSAISQKCIDYNGKAVVALVEACSAVVGIGDKQDLLLVEDELVAIGAESVLLPLSIETALVAKRKAAMKLFEMLKINEKGDLYCMLASSPSKPLAVTLLSRSPPIFLLNLPDHDRCFVRGSDMNPSSGCELKVLFPRQRTACIVKIENKLLYSLGIPNTKSGSNDQRGFVSENLRLAVLSQLCEMILIDQTNNNAEIEVPSSLHYRDNSDCVVHPSSSKSKGVGTVYVYWNPSAPFDLMEKWEENQNTTSSTFLDPSPTSGSSDQIISRDNGSNRSNPQQTQRRSSDSQFEYDDSMSSFSGSLRLSSSSMFNDVSNKRQDIEDRIVMKVAATLKFGVNEKVLRKVVNSSLEALLNGSSGESSALATSPNGKSPGASSVLLPDIKGLGMASLTALVQAAATSELARSNNNALDNEPNNYLPVSSSLPNGSFGSPNNSKNILIIHNRRASSSSSSSSAAAADAATLGSVGTHTAESKRLRNRKTLPFTPVLPTDNLTSYSLPCPVLSKKRGKGSPSTNLPPLPMAPFQWGYSR